MNPIDLPTFSIPLVALLVAYGLFVLFYLLYSAFNVYHLIRFSSASAASYLLVAIYSFGTIFLLAISILALSRYDWSLPLSLTEIFKGPETGASLFNL